MEGKWRARKQEEGFSTRRQVLSVHSLTELPHMLLLSAHHVPAWSQAASPLALTRAGSSTVGLSAVPPLLSKLLRITIPAPTREFPFVPEGGKATHHPALQFLLYSLSSAPFPTTHAHLQVQSGVPV